jgi:hypothetical protein
MKNGQGKLTNMKEKFTQVGVWRDDKFITSEVNNEQHESIFSDKHIEKLIE